MKYLLILLTLTAFISCSKDDKPVVQQQNQQKIDSEDTDNPEDTNLTPEEKFSSSILVDFLDDTDDEDLASFLENEIYKMGAGYNGVSVVEATPSTWLVSFEKNGNTKNYLLQKYVDFKTNEYYFTFKETSLNITDIIQRSKTRSPAGN